LRLGGYTKMNRRQEGIEVLVQDIIVNKRPTFRVNIYDGKVENGVDIDNIHGVAAYVHKHVPHGTPIFVSTDYNAFMEFWESYDMITGDRCDGNTYWVNEK